MQCTHYTNKHKSKSGKVFKCFKCGKPGHVRSQCGQSDFGKNAHSAASRNDERSESLCAFEVVQSNGTSIGDTNHVQSCCMNAQTNHSDDASSITFVLDSDSTDLLVGDKKHFSSLSKVNVDIGVTNKNASLNAKQAGEINVKICHNGKSSDAKMKNVLLTEQLNRNLMSVHQLTEKGFEVTFKKQCAIIQRDNETRFVAKRNRKLWEVELPVE